MRKPNYNKFPATEVQGTITIGWDKICNTLSAAAEGRHIIALELYTGTYEEEIIAAFGQITDREIICTRDLMKPEEDIIRMTAGLMTDDTLFGHVTYLNINDYFDAEKLEQTRAMIAASGRNWTIIGSGASLLADENTLLAYADMARWEIQQRFRRHEVKALGTDNSSEAPSLQYKRGYFNDWRICDSHKDKIMGQVEYWIDTHIAGTPKMIDRATFLAGLEKTAVNPFRVVPFFDPAPWGGQWMKEVCDLDRERQNFGWCFDCVPEENSLLFAIEGTLFEIPSVDLVLWKSTQLLGEAVEARFGKDFPIRFDFLDTTGGGNLSLQVHPTTQFIRDNFGMSYTQDESYYLLDAGEGAHVYIGLKTGIDKDEMIEDLRKAQRGEIVFDADKYANKIPTKKHDHFLIPGGTVHCSGAESMVLEISSTPNLFTFKLWDWQRLGLDGKPRPINVERGSKVINWGRDTEYVHEHLYNHVRQVAEGDGWREESTGLHPNEFIETRRHWFTAPVEHNTDGSVNVFNLIEGEEAIVESPDNAFEPFVVHYAETFIIPACIGKYTIRPYGASEGKECATIKAYVRFKK